MGNNCKIRISGHCDSISQLAESGETPLLGSREQLESEMKKLRDRLHTIESVNASMSVRLNQQEWEMKQRCVINSMFTFACF